MSESNERTINRYWKGFHAILFPSLCLTCEDSLINGEEVTCTTCMQAIPRTNYHLQKDNPVAQLFHGRIEPEFASSHFGFDKGGIFQELMHQLKYKEHPEIGVLLGQHAGAELKESPHLDKVDYVIPVPIHQKRLNTRGYNQSECIAKGLAPILNAAIDTTSLIRKTYTSSQTKLSREQRWSNVADNFHLTNHKTLENKHILLIDDVLTTGATLESCFETLKQTSGIRISILTLARAQ